MKLEDLLLIPDFPNYGLTLEDLVWSLLRKVPMPSGGFRTFGGYLLKLTYDNYGYPMVTLCNENGPKKFHLHVLVAMLRLGPPPFSGALVLHKNGKPENHRADNLYYGTYTQNALDRERHNKEARKHYSGRCKLTTEKSFRNSCSQRGWCTSGTVSR
jgi:hypothetical protein